MVRAIALVGFLAGCGRVGFDARGDGTSADARAGGTDDGGDGGGTGGSDIGHVQSSPVVEVFGPLTLTLPAASTAGSLLVIAFASNDTSNLVVPNGWTYAARASTNGGCWAGIMYLPDNPGGITSVMFSQPSGLPTAAQLTEWAGAAAAPLDAIGTAGAQNPATMQTVQTTTPTTSTDELAITSFCEDVNLPSYTSGAGWQNLGSFSNDASSPSFNSDFQFVAAPSIVAETITSSVTGKYAAVLATFRAP